MLSIDEINDKYKITEEQKLESEIYEAKKNGKFYIQVREKTLKLVACEKYKNQPESVSLPLYLEKLKASGYNVEKNIELPDSFPFMPVSSPKITYYISWENITVNQYIGLKKEIQEMNAKCDELNKIIEGLVDENLALIGRNLFQRILNTKGEI